MRKKIEQCILTNFGFSVTVVLRMAAELEWIISNCPFPEEDVAEAESSSETECLYVSLMTLAPLQERIDLLSTLRNESDEYRIIGREVFFLFRHSIRNSKLANHLQKLEVPATDRNWKMISKLAMMAKAMEN